MRGLAQYLARRFQVITFDWPGFGDSDRPAVDYTPPMYRQALRDLLGELGHQRIAAIAPGHTTAYVLQVAEEAPDLISKVVAVAPIWKSPFTKAGLRHLLGGMVRRIVRIPLLGALVYGTHSSIPFLQRYHGKTAYVAPEYRQGELLQQKQFTTQKSGARHAAIAFVTGGLDPVRNGQEFYRLFKNFTQEILVIRGEQVPYQLQEEMEEVEALAHLKTQALPGSLALHEEYPAELAKAVSPFLTPPLVTTGATRGGRWLRVSLLGALVVTAASVMAWLS